MLRSSASGFPGPLSITNSANLYQHTFRRAPMSASPVAQKIKSTKVSVDVRRDSIRCMFPLHGLADIDRLRSSERIREHSTAMVCLDSRMSSSPACFRAPFQPGLMPRNLEALAVFMLRMTDDFRDAGEHTLSLRSPWRVRRRRDR